MLKVKHRGEFWATQLEHDSAMAGLNASVENPAWFERAECKEMDPEIFFPLPSQSDRLAIEICHKCPVMEECGEWATVNAISDGIWGGLTPGQRKLVRERRQEQSMAEKVRDAANKEFASGKKRTVAVMDAWKRREVVAEMYAENMSTPNIAKALRVDERTVLRDRRLLRKEGLIA